MRRFVVLIWEPSDPPGSRQAEDWINALSASAPWQTVLQERGLRVLEHAPGKRPLDAVRFTGGGGIVLGHLFARGREGEGHVGELPFGATTRTLATGGEYLLANYWGAYVAIWRDASRRKVVALRDPGGFVPCFVAQARGAHLLFSHAEDIAGLSDLDLSVNWSFLQAFLLHPGFVNRCTAIREISELLPGERLAVGPEGASHLSSAWDAAHIAAQPDLRSESDLCASLRQTAEACFVAWARTFPAILVQLSGGLDSSVVLGMLRHCSCAHVSALHFVGAGYERYELELARLSAQQSGVDLVESQVDPSAFDLGEMLQGPRLPRPARQTFSRPLLRRLEETCCETGAEAIMAGTPSFFSAASPGTRLATLSACTVSAGRRSASPTKLQRFSPGRSGPLRAMRLQRVAQSHGNPTASSTSPRSGQHLSCARAR